MFTLKIIKDNFYKNIYNNFSPETPNGGESVDNNPFAGDSLQDLKKLKEFLKNGLTSSEAQIINEHFNDIEKEAKDGLKEIASNMLEEGFSAKNENSYNSFKALIEKNTGVKLPKWQDIIQRTINNLSEFSTVRTLGIIRKLNPDNFHGITIKNHIIEVRYDGWGTDDTLKLSYNKDNGKLSNNQGFNKWIEKEGEENDVENISNIKSDLLDDNIQSSEEKIKAAKEKQEQINLLNQIIDAINNYDINGKTEKDFENFIITHYDALKNIKGENYFNKAFSDNLELTEKIGKLINKKLLEIRKQNTPSPEETQIESETTNIDKKEKLIKKAIAWYRGKNPDSIKILQTKLGIPSDGIAGKQTVLAVMKFQEENQLKIDGMAGKQTLKTLGIEDINNFYKTKKQNTPKENINNDPEVHYLIDKDERIQAAEDFLEENDGILNFLLNTEASIGTYRIPLENGESYNIVLKKGISGDLKVELDGEGFIDDLDQNVNGTSLEDIKKAITLLIQKKQAEIRETDAYKEKKLIEKLGTSKEYLEIAASEIDAEYNGIKEKDGNLVLEIDRRGTNDINIGIKDGKIFVNDDAGLIDIKDIKQSELIQIIRDTGAYLGTIDELDSKIQSINNINSITGDNRELTPNELLLKKYLKEHNKIRSKEELKKVINDLSNFDNLKADLNKIEKKKKEFKDILEKLEKDGIIGKTIIHIDSGDYKGNYELTFKIDGDKLILDSAWNQPGTDKEIKIDMDKVIGKTNNQIMEYINSLKNKLIKEYKDQVKKEKRPDYDPTNTNNNF